MTGRGGGGRGSIRGGRNGTDTSCRGRTPMYTPRRLLGHEVRCIHAPLPWMREAGSPIHRTPGPTNRRGVYVGALRVWCGGKQNCQEMMLAYLPWTATRDIGAQSEPAWATDLGRTKSCLDRTSQAKPLFANRVPQGWPARLILSNSVRRSLAVRSIMEQGPTSGTPRGGLQRAGTARSQASKGIQAGGNGGRGRWGRGKGEE